MPLGMEYFPSTGVGQWEAIIDCIKAADFSIFILAGRYGSIDPRTGISWTHREYRESRKLGKPSIVLMHRNIDSLPRGKVETNSASHKKLMTFRKEVMTDHECRTWETESELVSGLLASIDHMKENHSITGWVHATPDPVVTDESTFNRTVLLMDTTHRYERSNTAPDHLNLYYSTRRAIRCNLPQGVSTVPLAWSRASDKLMPFDPGNPPTLQLDAGTRTGPGTVVLRPARKNTGATYTADIAFDPPLRQHEEADFSVTGNFPNYRFGSASRLQQATEGTPLGTRSFDFYSFQISYPTREFRVTVNIPTNLGITALGPRHGYHGQMDLPQSVSQDDEYKMEEVDIDGIPHYSMQLRVTDPNYRRRYRLAWQLP